MLMGFFERVALVEWRTRKLEEWEGWPTRESEVDEVESELLLPLLRL